MSKGRDRLQGSIRTAARLNARISAPAWFVTLIVAVLLELAFAIPAAAQNHVFDATLSLTGGTGVSKKLDSVPDPGPNHPPKPFNTPCGVAVDSNGYTYVANFGENGKSEPGVPPPIVNGRIDVFNPSGEFLIEIQNEFEPCSLGVDSAGNLYVVQEATDHQGLVRYSPKVYPPVVGTSYGSPSIVVSGPTTALAVKATDDHLFVVAGNGGSVSEYGSAAEGNPLLPTLSNSDIDKGTLNFAQSIAVDGESGSIYVGSVCTGCFPIPDEAHPFVSVVYVFDETGTFKEEVTGGDVPAKGFVSAFGHVYPAIDEATGELFVTDVQEGNRAYRFVPKTGGGYEYSEDSELEAHSYLEPARIAVANGAGSPNARNVYITSSNIPGHLFAFVPEAESGQPTIKETSFDEPTTDGVSLAAAINPEGLSTDFVFEYIDAATYQHDVEELGPGHGFDHALKTGAGSLPAGNQFIPVSSQLGGLTPGTTYRFRVSAVNHCKAAEPAVLCPVQGEEVAFATYPTGSGGVPCPNEALRTGASALLPDCRAYELVTPSDTNGREPVGRFITRETELAAGDGSNLLFTTFGGSLGGDLNGNGVVDGYTAERTPAGWETHLAGPTGAQSQTPLPGGASPDHGYWFWKTGGSADHGSLVVGGESTSYLRRTDGSFQLFGQGPLGSDPGARGLRVTAAGSHLIFSSTEQLTENASPPGVGTIYDRPFGGPAEVVSLKPDGNAPGAAAKVTFEGSSSDGSSVAFEVTEAGLTTLYLRRGGVTLTVALGNVLFAGIAADGSRLTYRAGGDLFSFDAATGVVSPVGSGGDSVPVNVSADGTHVYFVSTEVLVPGKGAPGKRNFYVWDAQTSSLQFIAVLSDQDVDGQKFNEETLVAYGLGQWLEGVAPSESAFQGVAADPSRTTPDGHAIVFESDQNLTEFDSDGHSEVYRYETGGSPALSCLSCDPTLSPATGDAHLQVLAISDGQAPTIPTTPVHNISQDGRIVFFQSPDPLVPTDVDGSADVYEWQAQGVGGCGRPEGCLSLISSGASSTANYLFAATRSGNDVFFTTSDLLTSSDQDVTASVYDARVGGGFPESGGAACEGEGCRPQAIAVPSLIAPDSSVKPSVPKRCGKGQRKVTRGGKTRCVRKRHKHRKHQHRSKKRSNATRGGSR
jgi:hypothetical protein